MYDNPEKFLAITFFTCAITYFFCLFIVFFVNLFGIVDHALKNKHSIHNRSTPRFGGIAIIFAILFTELIFGSIFKPWFFFAFLPIFIVGVMEDFNYQTKPAVRLLIGSVSSIMAIYLSNTWIRFVNCFDWGFYLG